MKKHEIAVLTLLTFTFPQMSLAGGNDSSSPTHKYWVCAISSYHSIIDGKRQEGKCNANTEYSEPRCREFVVEFEGDDGVRPGQPFKQTNQQDKPSTTTTIAINKEGDQHLYTHTIEKIGINATNKWVYNGKCNYYEASANEKIYMEKGLKTIP
jgi:hypothetical protein